MWTAQQFGKMQGARVQCVENITGEGGRIANAKNVMIIDPCFEFYHTLLDYYNRNYETKLKITVLLKLF